MDTTKFVYPLVTKYLSTNNREFIPLLKPDSPASESHDADLGRSFLDAVDIILLDEITTNQVNVRELVEAENKKVVVISKKAVVPSPTKPFSDFVLLSHLSKLSSIC